MHRLSPENDPPDDGHRPCHFLSPDQIEMIEEALCSLGDYGEVRLVVVKGRPRFLVTYKSFDALKLYPRHLKPGDG